MRAGLYDRIGHGYCATRCTDARLAAPIWRALGDAHTIVNVGAGSGAYEPPDRKVIAVEPSAVMIAQRSPHAAPVIQAHAEELPFPDGSFDAAMAVLSDHHWRDRSQGFQELRRVARERVVLVNANPGEAGRFWLTTEYLRGFLALLPERYRDPGEWERELRRAFGSVSLVPVPIPHDCIDGFYGAFWRRPEAYLDANVRAGISVFAQLAVEEVDAALTALAADLKSGRWHETHRELLRLDQLDLGSYVVVVEVGGG